MSIQGFRIGDEVYEQPSGFTIKDGFVIQKVTGIDPADFLIEYEQVQVGEKEPSYAVVVGALTLAIAQKHRDWTLSQIAEFVDNVDLTMITTVGEADAGPPDEATPDQGSPTSSGDSTTTPEPSPTAVPA